MSYITSGNRRWSSRRQSFRRRHKIPGIAKVSLGVSRDDVGDWTTSVLTLMTPNLNIDTPVIPIPTHISERWNILGSVSRG
jgi:hypothetical protein